MNTYTEAKERLGTRVTRKIGNNTYLKLRERGKIAVMLHDTDVVTYYPDGRIELKTGGWWTMTTFSRINEYSPVSVWSKRGKRMISKYDEKHERHVDLGKFFDGVIINEHGHILNEERNPQAA